MFIAALLITSKHGKYLRYSSEDKWINKVQYTQKMGYYSVLKRNKLSSYKRYRENLNAHYYIQKKQSEETT